MPIIGETVFDLGKKGGWSLFGAGTPWEPHHSCVAKIDGSKAYGDLNPKFPDGERELKEFLQWERQFYFKSELFLPFVEPEFLKSIFVSHHSWPHGIKDFKITFCCKKPCRGEQTIVHRFQMEKRDSQHYFWQRFEIEPIAAVISCKIEIISTWNGDLTQNHFNGIWFCRVPTDECCTIL
ncbi:hypothetical protein ADUPG1_012013 [Aduncisulcus paluster]|uniref:Uncharacterized protein n=1 Tax=Aduncisulcus paluster TaxID=2918883 RepID=A0ABQ5K252_9EUKA|nr:hypothetical protein ADUPG1_012013 [Aduncisulcus paluster]